MSRRRAASAQRSVSGPALLVILATLTGCASPRFFDDHRTLRGPVEVAPAAAAEHPRILPMYAGASGQALGWADLLEAVAWADVIVVGEQHDDAVGHAWQRALVEDTLDRHLGSVLSLEMLERDEQLVLDDYLDGIIGSETFTTLTHSAGWGGGDDGWTNWYLPIIDAAKEREAAVIAANAPRRYVRLARLRGYDALRRLPERRRGLVELPRAPAPEYRRRFEELMTQMREVEEDAEATEHEIESEQETEGTGSEGTEAEGAAAEGTELEGEAPEERELEGTELESPEPEETEHRETELSDDTLMAMFRSQRVWDATMADSIADAKRSGASKVIHLIGQFHSDFEGGLISELKRRMPVGSRLLVITMQRAWPDALRQADIGRADIVIYTGERPEEEAGEEAAEPSGDEEPEKNDQGHDDEHEEQEESDPHEGHPEIPQ